MEARRPVASERREIRLEVPCDPEWGGLVRLSVAGLAVYFDFSTALLEDLKLAVTEAFRHAIVSARDASHVQFVFDVGLDSIAIDVDCDAPVQSPSVDDAEVSLFVLRALVDEVSLGGERYHLRLTKNLE
jgi:hypothetical protein